MSEKEPERPSWSEFVSDAITRDVTTLVSLVGLNDALMMIRNLVTLSISAETSVKVKLASTGIEPKGEEN